MNTDKRPSHKCQSSLLITFSASRLFKYRICLKSSEVYCPEPNSKELLELAGGFGKFETPDEDSPCLDEMIELSKSWSEFVF